MKPSVRIGAAVGLVVLSLLLPSSVAAHAELVSSSPADGATIVGPFEGPIVLTFSEALADGSKADLVGPTSTSCGSSCTAKPDSQQPTEISFVLEGALELGNWEIRWTSVATDGDVLRGIIHFRVVAATAAPPTPTPTSSHATAPSNSAAASIVASPGPSPSSAGGTATDASAADILIPIAVVGILVGVGLGWFLRRRSAS